MARTSWSWRKKRYHHPCLLVAPVVNGEPVAPFNRRVLRVRQKPCSVESGSFGAVRHGGGKIKEVTKLGRTTVPLEKHLSIVDLWVEDALDGSGLSTYVVEKIQSRVLSNKNPDGTGTVELEVFSAVIVNKMEDEVFVYREPSSFP